MTKKIKLNPYDLYSLNKSEFDNNKKYLESYYFEYLNSNKILVLLEFWLYSFRSTIDCYGIEGAKKLCNDKETFSFEEFSFLNDYGFNIGSGAKRTYSKYFYYILSMFNSKYTGAGAPIMNIFDKIRWRISKLILLSSPINYSEQRKIDLIKILVKSFDVEYRNEITSCLENGLPVFFYASQNHVKIKSKLNITMEISPHELRNFSGLENILLFDKYVTLVGHQHGGAYGSYENEFFDIFERNISDKFIGWGLLELNKRQHRYVKHNTKKNINLDKRLIWVERRINALIYKYIMPSCYNHGVDDTAIISIYNSLKESNANYINLPYSGIFRCPMYEKYREFTLTNTGNGEDIIHNNDVLIFDNFYSTLIFYCIENGNMFICVTSHQDVDSFTELNLEWFNILYSHGLAFYDDELESIKNKLLQMSNNPNVIPKEVAAYHYLKFINI